MSATQPAVAADEVRLDEAETVALAYFQAAQRNGWSALVALAADALAERDDLARLIHRTMADGGFWADGERDRASA